MDAPIEVLKVEHNVVSKELARFRACDPETRCYFCREWAQYVYKKHLVWNGKGGGPDDTSSTPHPGTLTAGRYHVSLSNRNQSKPSKERSTKIFENFKKLLDGSGNETTTTTTSSAADSSSMIDEILKVCDDWVNAPSSLTCLPSLFEPVEFDPFDASLMVSDEPKEPAKLLEPLTVERQHVVLPSKGFHLLKNLTGDILLSHKEPTCDHIRPEWKSPGDLDVDRKIFNEKMAKATKEMLKDLEQALNGSWSHLMSFMDQLKSLEADRTRLMGKGCQKLVDQFAEKQAIVPFQDYWQEHAANFSKKKRSTAADLASLDAAFTDYFDRLAGCAKAFQTEFAIPHLEAVRSLVQRLWDLVVPTIQQMAERMASYERKNETYLENCKALSKSLEDLHPTADVQFAVETIQLETTMRVKEFVDELENLKRMYKEESKPNVAGRLDKVNNKTFKKHLKKVENGYHSIRQHFRYQVTQKIFPGTLFCKFSLICIEALMQEGELMEAVTIEREVKRFMDAHEDMVEERQYLYEDFEEGMITGRTELAGVLGRLFLKEGMRIQGENLAKKRQNSLLKSLGVQVDEQERTNSSKSKKNKKKKAAAAATTTPEPEQLPSPPPSAKSAATPKPDTAEAKANPAPPESKPNTAPAENKAKTTPPESKPKAAPVENKAQSVPAETKAKNTPPNNEPKASSTENKTKAAPSENKSKPAKDTPAETVKKDDQPVTKSAPPANKEEEKQQKSAQQQQLKKPASPPVSAPAPTPAATTSFARAAASKPPAKPPQPAAPAAIKNQTMASEAAEAAAAAAKAPATKKPEALKPVESVTVVEETQPVKKQEPPTESDFPPLAPAAPKKGDLGGWGPSPVSQNDGWGTKPQVQNESQGNLRSAVPAEGNGWNTEPATDVTTENNNHAWGENKELWKKQDSIPIQNAAAGWGEAPSTATKDAGWDEPPKEVGGWGAPSNNTDNVDSWEQTKASVAESWSNTPVNYQAQPQVQQQQEHPQQAVDKWNGESNRWRSNNQRSPATADEGWSQQPSAHKRPEKMNGSNGAVGEKQQQQQRRGWKDDWYNTNDDTANASGDLKALGGWGETTQKETMTDGWNDTTVKNSASTSKSSWGPLQSGAESNQINGWSSSSTNNNVVQQQQQQQQQQEVPSTTEAEVVNFSLKDLLQQPATTTAGSTTTTALPPGLGSAPGGVGTFGATTLPAATVTPSLSPDPQQLLLSQTTTTPLKQDINVLTADQIREMSIESLINLIQTLQRDNARLMQTLITSQQEMALQTARYTELMSLSRERETQMMQLFEARKQTEMEEARRYILSLEARINTLETQLKAATASPSPGSNHNKASGMTAGFGNQDLFAGYREEMRSNHRGGRRYYNKQPVIRCGNCGETGHTSAECKDACRYCGASDHLSEACTMN